MFNHDQGSTISVAMVEYYSNLMIFMSTHVDVADVAVGNAGNARASGYLGGVQSSTQSSKFEVEVRDSSSEV